MNSENQTQNNAVITGITLVWTEYGSDENLRFDSLDRLQKWFEKTYLTANFDRMRGYCKNKVEVAYTCGGQKKTAVFRIDVSGDEGDFNPYRKHIGDYLGKELAGLGIK